MEESKDYVSSSEDDEAKEAKARERWEKKLYKPTGPDGQGWGDFRKMTNQEEMILDELLKIERQEAKRREKLIQLDALKAEKLQFKNDQEKEMEADANAQQQSSLQIMDEDARWELALRQKQEADR